MPSLHYFNPGHETAVLNGSPYYMAPINVELMQKELAYIPAWYASLEDYVLIDKQPPFPFFERLAAWAIQTATPITRSEIKEQHLALPPAIASPWGVSPQCLHHYKQLADETGWLLSIPVWDEVYTRLCGRQTAAFCLRLLLNQLPELDKSLIPRFYYSLPEIEAVVCVSGSPLLLKTPYSSSGRGLLWLNNSQLTRSDAQWISGALKKQGTVSIEPGLNKKQDFAMEFFSDGNGILRYEGLSFFTTATQGAYAGNYLGSQQEIVRKLRPYIDEVLLKETQESLTYLLQEVYGNVYTGYLGVDMMIYEDATGTLRLHPCVEINMRCTMGLLAVKLSERLLSAQSEGFFAISYHPTDGEAWQVNQQQEATYPLRCVQGKITEGYLSLCPVTPESKYLASVLVSPPPFQT